MEQKKFFDAEIVKNLEENREVDASIRFLYREHFFLLSRYIVSNSGNEQDAEDIFQDVMVAFIHLVQAGKFRGESTIKTFLYSLNRNIWLNELKRRGRAALREEKFENSFKAGEKPIDLQLEVRQTKKELFETIEALGENCKKILLLYYYENKSMKEIVEELPYENEQVVRNKKSKCMKKLTELVKGNSRLYEHLKIFLNE